MSRQPAQRHAEPQTKMTTAESEELYEFSCHLQRSIRYHKARERFFASWSNWFSFASLLAGSSVVVALLASAPAWMALSAGAAIAAMQAIEQVFRLSSSARDHNALASEFASIERIVAREADITQDTLCDLKAEVLAIEAREPPVKRYLDLICHNQVAKAVGSDDIETLSWFQRTFAQYLNGDTALQK